MKKLYSKFVESRVKQYLLSHEGDDTVVRTDRHLSLIRPGSPLWQTWSWQPAVAKAPAATRWVE